MSKIQVIMCPAERAPYVTNIQDSLDNMQKIVGGYIETAKIAKYTIIVCSEEGRTLGMPENNSLPVSGFCGDCFICAVDGDRMVSLDNQGKQSLLRSCGDRWNSLWEEKHGN